MLVMRRDWGLSHWFFYESHKWTKHHIFTEKFKALYI